MAHNLHTMAIETATITMVTACRNWLDPTRQAVGANTRQGVIEEPILTKGIDLDAFCLLT